MRKRPKYLCPHCQHGTGKIIKSKNHKTFNVPFCFQKNVSLENIVARICNSFKPFELLKKVS